jgi:hypothetical protein
MFAIYADKLLEFLTELAISAKAQGHERALKRINFARLHYDWGLTTEFLGVSMLVLKELLDQSSELFSSEQIKQITEYVTEIKRQYYS